MYTGYWLDFEGQIEIGSRTEVLWMFGDFCKYVLVNHQTNPVVQKSPPNSKPCLAVYCRVSVTDNTINHQSNCSQTNIWHVVIRSGQEHTLIKISGNYILWCSKPFLLNPFTTKRTFKCPSLLGSIELVTYIPGIEDFYGDNEDEQDYIARILKDNIRRLPEQG